jgi:hypothetical protein
LIFFKFVSRLIKFIFFKSENLIQKWIFFARSLHNLENGKVKKNILIKYCTLLIVNVNNAIILVFSCLNMTLKVLEVYTAKNLCFMIWVYRIYVKICWRIFLCITQLIPDFWFKMLFSKINMFYVMSKAPAATRFDLYNRDKNRHFCILFPPWLIIATLLKLLFSGSKRWRR